jgi:hypothetical protein
MNQLITAIQESLDRLSGDAEQGNICPLETYMNFKELNDFISDRIDVIKPSALKEAEKYKGDVNGYNGYIVDVREVGGKYDYSHIDEIAQLKERIKELEKSAQNAYKIGLNGGAVVNGDGEEVIPANYKSGTTAIVLKLKKTLF